MLVIPAIDLKSGQCVRLYQGDLDRATVYSDDPIETALFWQSQGAQRLHVVDLDGAVAGQERNSDAIASICKNVSIPVQVGGGIRTLPGLERLMALGANKAILGTAAYLEPALVDEACKLFPGNIIVGIDTRNNKVAIQGWTEATDLDAIDLALRCEDQGVSEIVYTDISRDGTETGVNYEATILLAKALSIPVIASGGVASMADIDALLPLEDEGVMGVIVGRAIYTGALDLAEAVKRGSCK